MAAGAPKSDGASPETVQSSTTEPRVSSKEATFAVPSWLHVLGGLVHRHPRFWRWLASVEASFLEVDLHRTSMRRPIFISGLARSGSTLLHELVAAHPQVATHRIKDYPLIFTPYWWRRATAKQRPPEPRERPHHDGVMITSDSPDALEEMVWMAFFPHCHDPAVSNILGAADHHPAFETFYNTHLRKLLLVEQRTRYAAKANYHVARLTYLLRLFPDARFLIPVRAPASHIASLRRQQERFSRGQREHPRALAFMQRSGHFEFGLDRRPLHLGDAERVQQILQAWAKGDEVRGLALHWDMVHRYLMQLLAMEDQLRAATLVVPFEALCASPAEMLRRVFAHCALPDADALIEQYAARIRFPSYYDSRFSAEELTLIHELTAHTARQMGYDP
jgi:hypothetical protein